MNDPEAFVNTGTGNENVVEVKNNKGYHYPKTAKLLINEQVSFYFWET